MYSLQENARLHSLQEDAHLRDYLQIIRRHKNIALLFFIVIVGGVTTASFVITPTYKATTTIFIDLESPNMLTATDSVALGTQNYYAYKEYYQSQKDIIKSRRIANAVFGEYKLIEKPKYAKAKEPLEEFLKTISVESVRDTRLVKLHVENEDAALAASIANRIAELYVRQNLEYITRDEYLNLLKNEYLKLQSRLSEYTKVYKDKHPKMVRLQEQIVQIAGRIEAEKKKTMMNVGTEDAFLASADESRDPAHSSASLGEVNNSNLSSLDVRLDGLKANNIRILDPAEEPIVPVRPRKRLNVILALLVGLFGGIGLTLFAEYLDTTVKGERDIEHHIKMPFLGTVPRIEAERANRKFSELEKDIICHLAPDSIAAEAYRAIRTGVLFSSDEGRTVKDMIVTSPGPREGKTTTACNLAITFANLGHKVLLIDADLRKPRLHKIFGVDNDVGLRGFLRSADNINGLLEKDVKMTQIENLAVLPAGPHNSNPSEMLGSARMKDFIKKVKEKFDIILLDTPPINVITDATILAGFVGGVIVVVEGGRTMKNILSRTERLLKNVKAKIIGIVMNNIAHIDRESPYYYSHYYYAGKKEKHNS